MTDTPIDTNVFAELQGSIGADFAIELVNAFLDEAPIMQADLHGALERGDSDQFRRAAHSIKSNAQIFGAHELAELARQLELSGADPDPHTAKAQLNTLEAAYVRAADALKGLQNG